jgi:hypothetical protein
LVPCRMDHPSQALIVDLPAVWSKSSPRVSSRARRKRKLKTIRAIGPDRLSPVRIRERKNMTHAAPCSWTRSRLSLTCRALTLILLARMSRPGMESFQFRIPSTWRRRRLLRSTLCRHKSLRGRSRRWATGVLQSDGQNLVLRAHNIQRHLLLIRRSHRKSLPCWLRLLVNLQELLRQPRHLRLPTMDHPILPDSPMSLTLALSSRSLRHTSDRRVTAPKAITHLAAAIQAQ